MENTMNTSGFYKIEGNETLFSCTTVESATYFLIADRHKEYQYPVDGWYWFDSEIDAKNALLDNGVK